MDERPRPEATREQIDAAVRLAGWLPPEDRAIERAPRSANDEGIPPSRTRPMQHRMSETMPDDSPIVSERVLTLAAPVLDGAQAMLPTEPAPVSKPKPRGFAAMTPAERAAISAKGGKAAQVSGKAHRFTSEEARAAGRKGGAAPHVSRGTQRRAVQPTLPIRGEGR